MNVQYNPPPNYESALIEIGILRTQLKTLEDKIVELETKLDARPNFEIKEKEVVPSDSRNTPYLSREEQWYLSLKYRVTPAACILCERFGTDIDFRKLAKTMASVFKHLSTSISHKNPESCLFSEAGWKILFEYAKVEIDDREIVKKALQPPTSEENKMSELTVPLTLYKEMVKELGRVKEQLCEANKKIEWFHTQLKLRGPIERAEKKLRPQVVEKSAWAAKTRREKWFLILSDEKRQLVFKDFIECLATEIKITKKLLLQFVNYTYGYLNARIHNYVSTDVIDDSPFTDDQLNKISHCIELLSKRLF